MRAAGSLALVPLVLVSLGASCSNGSSATPTDAGHDAIVDASLWDGTPIPYEAATPPAVPRTPVSSTLVTLTADVQGMMFSAGEMQISGEPFAEFFAGRNLNYYDRAFLPPDRYLLPVTGGEGDDDDGGEDADDGGDGGGIVYDALLNTMVDPILDPFGFSTAVESYEYSKYHMNSIVEWGSVGISMINGPLVDALKVPPQDDAGQTDLAQLVLREGQLLTLAGTDVGGYAQLPAPETSLNTLGFPGLTPVFAPFSAFDPVVPGNMEEVQSCNLRGGYGGIPMPGNETPALECEYLQLHVPDAAQSHLLVPAVLGFATWKQALWAIDFAGRLHDSASNPVNAVAPQDVTAVGTHGNTVVGIDTPGAAVGTYVGSTPLEGMWGLNMVAGMDNLDQFILDRLTTSDGKTLGGFSSLLDATEYDFTSPLRWFPYQVTASVDPGLVAAPDQFPPLTGLSIANPATDAQSRSIDLAAFLLGNAMLFGMTDSRNPGIWGTHPGLPVLFDGTHTFEADDAAKFGQPTLHDRALSMLRVALVDLVRLHQDPSTGLFADTATVANGKDVTRGTTVTTTNLAHILIGLRQTILSLNAAVTQYGSADESPAADAQGILNAIPIHPPGGGTPPFCTYLRSLFTTNAETFMSLLTTAEGTVSNGATLADGKASAVTGPALLESQAAAARAMTEAFLLIGDPAYQVRAQAIVRHMVSAFFNQPAQMFIGQEGGPVQVSMTPERYGWLQSSLRETYKSLWVTGDPVLGRPALEPMIARIGKLYLNGWDDLNGNHAVDKPQECLSARMQGSEQALTGEFGRDAFGQQAPDLDGDCVPWLAYAGPNEQGSLAVFAGEVSFTSP